MPLIDKRWEKLKFSDWSALAESWLKDLCGLPSGVDFDIGQTVVMMNFSATPEQQWTFILAAVLLAESDDELDHIAAGPIEHLLGWHGEKYIDIVELQAENDPKFARTLTGVWKYKMTDEVWNRIQALQKKVTNRLKPSTDNNKNA